MVDGFPGFDSPNGWMVVLVTHLGTTGRERGFGGNTMNFDVYSVEFGVYISDILMETLKAIDCLDKDLRKAMELGFRDLGGTVWPWA